MLLDKALTLVIPGKNIRDMNQKDLEYLLDNYAITEQAKDSFLKQEITFEEYLELLEMAQVNIDSYATSLETNLQALKIL